MPTKHLRRDDEFELTLHPTPEQEVELLKLMNGADSLYIPADEIQFFPTLDAARKAKPRKEPK